MMFKTIIQLLNGDREISFSRQPAATDETNESSETKIPFKFKTDIEALQRLYPEAFEKKDEIVLSLKEALEILPRDRARTDSYRTLQEWLLNNMNVTLSIRSQKHQRDNYG